MKRFWQSRWRDSVIIGPLLVVGWFAYGFVFTDKLFDTYLNNLAVLRELDVILAYVGALFAIQIPVFILLLEKMHSAGYIRRLVLPSVISFREILVCYVVLSFLLLVAPRAAYFYFPVLGLTALSLYTLYESVRVMFETRKLKAREDLYIEKLIERALHASLKGRVSINNFFETIKEFSYITHSLLDIGHDDKETDKHYVIRTRRTGIIESIDVKKLYELMSSEYYSNIPKANGGKARDAESHEQKARLVLLVRPKSNVKIQDEVIKLVLADSVEQPTGRFINNLAECIKTKYDHPDSADRQMDDIIKDFKQQIRAAIDKDDVVAVDEALGIYELLAAGLATLHFSDEDSGYDLDTARNEFHQMFSDSVSDRLRLIAEVIEDEFEYAVRTEHQEAVKSLVSSMYKSILQVTDSFDILTVARAERAFAAAVAFLLYSDDATLPNRQYREYVLEMLTFRLKEHTGLLLYNYRDYNDSMSFTKNQLEQWIEMRLNDVRSLTLGAYKKSNLKMFKELKGVLDTVEDDYELYQEQVESFALLARSMLFVIAAYVHGKTAKTNEQKEAQDLLDGYFKDFSAQEITQVLVECIDKDYAEKWRIDTSDLIADGKMHEVPDFNIKLKSLWVEYMLALSSIPGDVQDYESIPIAKTGAFTDQMPDANKAFLLQHLESLTEKGKDTTMLKELVQKFIRERLKWENETLAEAVLDNEMVDDFRKSVTKSYAESALALSVFEPSGHLKFVTKAPKGFLSYGWNQIQDKYGFIKGWHIGVGHQTHEYGRKIARAENNQILESLLATPSQQFVEFETWIKKLRRNKTKQWFIVSVGVAEWHVRFHRSDIVKHLETDRPRSEMEFKNVNQLGPIYYAHMKTLPKGFYAIPVDDIGILQIKGTVEHPVKVSIDAYSHDKLLLKAITKSPPVWLLEKGDTDEQIAFLKTQVRMLIQHPFRYNPVSKPEVYFYPVIDRDSD